jgi:hypothetical protein
VSGPRPYSLSYDVRSRNTPMETSREAARIAIESTIAQLKEIVPDVPFDAPVTLHAITPYSQTMQTTFGREVVDRSFGFHDRLTLFPFPVVVCRFTCCSSLVHGMNVLHFCCLIPAPLTSPRPADPRTRRRTGLSHFVPSLCHSSSSLSFRESNLMDRLGLHRQH